VPARKTLRTGGSSQAIATSYRSPLARLLEAPELGALVPRLPAQTLHALVEQAGLHACGDLIAAATPGQLVSVLDLDLWQHARAGQDEQFDARRFGEWLEVLAETGASVSARIVAALDEDLVVAGLSRHVRVFDPAAIALPASMDDSEPSDAATTPHDGPECELGGYLVRGIGSAPWDAIVTLLAALADDYQPCFDAVMRGCRRLSNSTPEVDGLDELFTDPQQQLHDVAVSRERRRSQQGHSTPADARAFLQMARHRTREPRDSTRSMNPIAAAYFQAADHTATSADGDCIRVAGSDVEAPATDPQARDAIAGLLVDAGLLPQRPLGLIAAPASEPSRAASMRRLLEYACEKDENAYFGRTRELAFLTNTLMAGCSVQSRPFTAREASEAVVGICNLGLEHWPARWPESGRREAPSMRDSVPDTFLVDHDLVTTFEVGWSVLYEDVSVFVAEHLVATLMELRCVDPEIEHGLTTLRRALVRERDVGTPWRARDALDVIGMLDMPAWASLVGLLDECPVVPHALIAILDRRTCAVSATSFDFIFTAAQLGAIRVFMRMLPDVLGG
jgi:hypothetical protein